MTSMTGLSQDFAAIQRIVGENSFSLEASTLAAYGVDRSFAVGDAGAVCFPRSAELVAAVLGCCNERNIAVVPSGGRTGLVGGATALKKSLVLSLDKLTTIGEVDSVAESVHVGAGVTTQQVHEHCEALGLTWPVDIASKGTSQIGGNIATNAGGIHVLRYGMTRNWVLGLRVATMDGKLLEMNRNLVKNNTNWDLMQLFIGSEGTLGVVTDATLRLTQLPSKRQTLFIGANSLETVTQLLTCSRKAPWTLHAFEFLDAACLRETSTFLRIRNPLGAPCNYYVVLEFDVGKSQESIEAWAVSLEIDGLQDAVVAQNETQRNAMWKLREGLGEALYAIGPGKTHDVSVPLSKTAAFVRIIRKRLDEALPELNVYLFGHVGDGNVHAHLVFPAGLSAESQAELVDTYDSLVYNTVVADYGGSISAEHGIGLEKRKYLHLSRSPLEIAVYSKVKNLFDPKGLLNPGKVLPAGASE